VTKGARPAMTEEELRDYSADHLYYELFMLYETASRLRGDPAVEGDWVVMNALIESFTIHARALMCFLYPGEKTRPYPTDVTAECYVSDVTGWRRVRGTLPSMLETVKTRTSKETAHLTTGRHPAGSPLKGWSPELILRAFFEPLRAFAEHVPAGRLDVSVTAFIAALPGPAFVPGLEALGAGAPEHTADLTPEHLSRHTDVLTTSDVAGPPQLRPDKGPKERRMMLAAHLRPEINRRRGDRNRR
jgi:hypothetical protein